MPAITPVGNVGSQIERAILAYLQSVMEGADAAATGFYFSNDWRTRSAPLIDVLAHKSTETTPHTRNESFAVRIEVKWPGNNIAGETNPDTNWVAINNLVGTVMAAMSEANANGDTDTVPATTSALITAAGRALAVDQSSGADPALVQAALNNADMLNFTCDYIEFKGSQRAESSGDSFIIKEVRNFEVRAHPYNSD